MLPKTWLGASSQKPLDAESSGGLTLYREWIFPETLCLSKGGSRAPLKCPAEQGKTAKQPGGTCPWPAPAPHRVLMALWWYRLCGNIKWYGDSIRNFKVWLALKFQRLIFHLEHLLASHGHSPGRGVKALALHSPEETCSPYRGKKTHRVMPNTGTCRPIVSHSSAQCPCKEITQSPSSSEPLFLLFAGHEHQKSHRHCLGSCAGCTATDEGTSALTLQTWWKKRTQNTVLCLSLLAHSLVFSAAKN